MKSLIHKAVFIFFIFITATLSSNWNEEYNYVDPDTDTDLILLKTDPIDINNASEAELHLLPWLSNEQIQNIIQSRRDKPFKNKTQLIGLGINEIILEEMEDYITFSYKPDIRCNNSVRFELNRSRLEKRSCLKVYSRTMIHWDDLEAGLVTEKDQGEKNILDFYSYYFHWRGQNWLKQVIIGKYQLYSGLGLLMNSKLGSSRNITSAGSVLRLRTTVRPYKSAYECWGLEGCSAELQLGRMKFLPVYSKASLSANLESGRITSFNETGLNYHPAKKNNVKEIIYGLFTGYKSDHYSFALGFLQQEFDHQFVDSLMSNSISSYNFSFELWKKSLPLCGEIACSNDKLAAVIGLTYRTNNLKQQIIFRKYEKYFPDWHGNAFAASSSFPNEEGLYYGFTCTPFKTLKLGFYFDLWKIPETAYYEKMPTSGNEFMLYCALKIPDENLVKYQLKLKKREKYIALEESRIRDLQQLRTRLGWEKQIGRIKLSSRLDYAEDYLPLENKIKQGFLFSQLIKYQNERSNIVLQLACFDTDLVQYLYAYSVDGAMSSNVLNGNDLYFNLLVSYMPLHHLKLQSCISGCLQNTEKMKMAFQIMTNY